MPLTTFFTLVRHGIRHDLVYPARAVIWSLMSVVYMLVFPFVWLAIYGPREELFGFDRIEIVTYFVGLLLVDFFTAAHVNEDLNEMVRDGNISARLLKPIGVAEHEFAYYIGRKIPRITVALLIAAAAVILFPQNVALPEHWWSWALLPLLLLLGFVIAYNASFIIGCLAFWFQDVQSLLTMYGISIVVFQGWVGPLVFFPDWFQTLNNFLPFQYTLYFPLMMFLENITPQQVMTGTGITAAWAIGLTVLRRQVFKRAVKHYNAVGG